MKKTIFALIFGFISFFAGAQAPTHAIDTSGNLFILHNLTANTKWILPKTNFHLSLNTDANRDNLGLYVIGQNTAIYTGKLSLVNVPGATTLVQKYNFLKKHLSFSISGGGGTADSKEAKQDVQIVKAQNALDSIAKVILELQKLRQKAIWKGDSIATYTQRIVVAKENKQDVEINVLTAIDSKLNWEHNRLVQDIETFETATAGATGTIQTKMLGAFSIENIGTSNGLVTFQNGDILTLKPSETFIFKGYEFPESKQFIMCFDVNFDAQSSNFRIIKTYAKN